MSADPETVVQVDAHMGTFRWQRSLSMSTVYPRAPYASLSRVGCTFSELS